MGFYHLAHLILGAKKPISEIPLQISPQSYWLELGHTPTLKLIIGRELELP